MAASPVHLAQAEEFALPLGLRSYGLRHAAVAMWLNAGVPTTGHSVAVLAQTYAKPAA